MVKNIYRYSRRVSDVLVSQILTKLGFLKNISNLIKVGPAGAELFRADEHDEANTRFSQFCERGEKRTATDNKSRP